MKKLLILLCGEPKTGKTVSAASFPKPMRFLDYDGGTLSIFNTTTSSGQRLIKEVEKIDFVNLYESNVKPQLSLTIPRTEGKDVPKIPPPYTDHAVEIINKTNAELANLSDHYKTLVIDSLTSLFRVWKLAFLKINMLSTLRVQDYMSLEGVLFGQFIPMLKSLPIPYIICVDHTDLDKDEILGTIIEYPIGPSRNMGRQLAKEFDEVWKQKMEGGEPVWKTRQTMFFQAGSRLNLPDTIKPPLFETIESLINK